MPSAATKVPRLTAGNAPGKLAVARAAKARARASLKSVLKRATAGLAEFGTGAAGSDAGGAWS